jgi:hypothetical protein
MHSLAQNRNESCPTVGEPLNPAWPPRPGWRKHQGQFSRALSGWGSAAFPLPLREIAARTRRAAPHVSPRADTHDFDGVADGMWSTMIRN